MPLGLIRNAGKSLMGWGWEAGAAQAAAGQTVGLAARGAAYAGRFMRNHSQATMYGGMMGIGAGYGALSDRSSAIEGALWGGGLAAGLRYGAAGLRGASRAGAGMGIGAHGVDLFRQAGKSIWRAGRADFNKAMAIGRRARGNYGPKLAGQAPANPVPTPMNKGSSAAAAADTYIPPTAPLFRRTGTGQRPSRFAQQPVRGPRQDMWRGSQIVGRHGTSAHARTVAAARRFR